MHPYTHWQIIKCTIDISMKWSAITQLNCQKLRDFAVQCFWFNWSFSNPLFHVSVFQYTPMIALTVRKALGERYSEKLLRLFRKPIRSIFFFECLSSFWWSNQEIVDDRHVHLDSIKMKVSFIRDFIRCFTGGLRKLRQIRVIRVTLP